ncbi:MAG: endonuclease/exonuclease/phosphatase family protein [Actinomycetota bacterium]
MNVCGLPSSLAAPRLRATEFCRQLEESRVDVINLQEVWTRQLLEVIRGRLPSFAFVAWQPGFAGQPAGGLASFSRLPLGNVSFTSLRSIRPSAGTAVFRALKAVNSRLQGVLTTELASRPVMIGNVHLSANRDGDWSTGNRHYGFQRAQLTALQDALRRGRALETELVIASGDLNIPSSSPLYPQIVEGGAWRDPFADADLPTFHPELLPSGRTPHRIDYLLVSGDAQRYPVLEAAVVLDEPVSLPGYQRMFLSDHLSLVIRVGTPAHQ